MSAFDFELIRSRRRTLALEVARDGRVLVRAPMRTPQARIDAFVEQHTAWVLRHLKQQAERPAPPPDTPEEIAALKMRAAELLPERVAYWSAVTGLRPSGVKITTARKRYGSCNAKGGLCFSCFLMRCPPEAIDLVVVHELCHIRERGHGPRFYRLLASYLPDWKERKKLLC